MEKEKVDNTDVEKDQFDLETTETKTEVEELVNDRPKRSSLVIPRNVDKDKRDYRMLTVAFNDEPAEIDNTDTTDSEKDLEKKAGNSKRTKEQIIQQLRLTIDESSFSFIPSSHSSYPVTPPVARREGDDPPTPPPTPCGTPHPSSVMFGDTLYNMNDQMENR
eukprot:GFUD01037193.1.p1 GENE.GFUD01037193.1~~GFUD01037193.1.p1  ORF type:complete len:163 (+),score=62.65 GFUD01037193.1:205-693(+)